MPRRSIPEGIRITKVGLLYIALAIVVGIAAANTGNNALYIVEALLLGVLVLSGITSRRNVAGLDVELLLPEEVHAKEPFTATYRMRNRDRWAAVRWIAVEGVSQAEPLLLSHLGRGGEEEGTVQAFVRTRGRYRVDFVHLSSVFPFGFFRKGLRLAQEAEMLVFPELFPAAPKVPAAEARSGERSSRRKGQGHELFQLRSFQPGDDRRGVHWKQTARTGQMVFMEREAESGRRLSIILDNGVGELERDVDRQRFERLVSEAATAADEALRQGYSVGLRTRSGHVALGSGPGQRHRIMKQLALLEPCPRSAEPLGSTDPRLPQLRLAMDSIGLGSAA